MTTEERDRLLAEQRERERWGKTNTAGRLRIKAESPALMNKKPILTDNTPSPVRAKMTARRRLEIAPPNQRLAVVLATREWQGSTVQQSTSTRGETVYGVQHPSGAHMRLIGEVLQ